MFTVTYPTPSGADATREFASSLEAIHFAKQLMDLIANRTDLFAGQAWRQVQIKSPEA